MAGLHVVAKSGEVASGTAAKTILQLVAPSNHRLHVWRYSISAKGTNPNQTPILVEFIQQSTAGSGGSTATPAKSNQSDDETPQSSMITGITSEPTGTVVVESFYLQPAGGLVIYDNAPSKPIPIPGSQRLGVRVTADTNTTVQATLYTEE